MVNASTHVVYGSCRVYTDSRFSLVSATFYYLRLAGEDVALPSRFTGCDRSPKGSLDGTNRLQLPLPRVG
jgi:hypothetical protein